ncbi:MAG: helix-turn-helix transcriptional regulator [Clostridia bacterium]|nr:helix-turn-helix transcriptional regulator [Clostridia bacterium]
MIFSDKLQIIRKSKGITQEELAEKLGLSRQAIAKWESGMTYPDITNLIQLSELFHITIDYLVKDNECSKSPVTTLNTDKEKLIDFRLEAIRNTYAGYANNCEASRPKSHDYFFEKGNYQYYDTWLGGEAFSGEEAIWKNGTPVYAMNYCGRNLDERFSGDFLKEALRNASPELPYRGPEFYQAGEYTYKTKVIGDIDWFQGYEEIFCQDIKVYECFYHGGILA